MSVASKLAAARLQALKEQSRAQRRNKQHQNAERITKVVGIGVEHVGLEESRPRSTNTSFSFSDDGMVGHHIRVLLQE